MFEADVALAFSTAGPRRTIPLSTTSIALYGGRGRFGVLVLISQVMDLLMDFWLSPCLRTPCGYRLSPLMCCTAQ